MRHCVINLPLCTPNALNRVKQIGSYEYVLELPYARGSVKERQMSIKGKSVLLAVSALGLILAGAGPALAQHAGGGGGHAGGGGGGHAMGGGHAAGGHVSGGAHFAGPGHFAGGGHVAAAYHGGGYAHAGFAGRPGYVGGHGYSTGWRGGAWGGWRGSA